MYESISVLLINNNNIIVKDKSVKERKRILTKLNNFFVQFDIIYC